MVGCYLDEDIGHDASLLWTFKTGARSLAGRNRRKPTETWVADLWVYGWTWSFRNTEFWHSFVIFESCRTICDFCISSATSGTSTNISSKTTKLDDISVCNMVCRISFVNSHCICRQVSCCLHSFNTLRTGDADLRFYNTTVIDGWRKSAFLTRACFPCTIHLIMQYIEPVSEWFCWRMFIETWPYSD